MPTAEDIAAQLRQADEQKRQAERMRIEQKELLRRQISELDGQIAKLKQQRDRAAADLSTLG